MNKTKVKNMIKVVNNAVRGNEDYTSFKVSYKGIEEDIHVVRIDMGITQEFFEIGIDKNIDDEDYEICEFVQDMIYYMYGTLIYAHNKDLKKLESTMKRRQKSLALWSSRGNQKKVDEILNDMINVIPAETKALKIVIQDYKDISRELYELMDSIDPNWKGKYLLKYTKERILNNITARSIVQEMHFDIDFKIVAKIKGTRYYFTWNSYTNKNEIFNQIMTVVYSLNGGRPSIF